MRTKKYFNIIRWLGVAAIICTLIIAVVVITESLTPAAESAAKSEIWTEGLQDYVGDRFDKPVGTEPVREIRVTAFYGYTGSRKKVAFSTFPADSRPTEFTYEVSNPAVAEVSEDGYVTFKNVGDATLTVRVKDDPSVYGFTYITSYGPSPAEIESAYPNKTTILEGAIFQNFRLIDQNGNAVSSDCFNITMPENSPVRIQNQFLTGMKPGKCTVTFSPKGFPDKQFSYEFEVIADPNCVRATGVTLKTAEITVNKGDLFDVPRLAVDAVSPANANRYCFIGYIHNPANKTVLSSISGQVKKAEREGTATVTIVDNISYEARAEVTVRVVVPETSKLTIAGNKQVQLNYKYQFTAEGDHCNIENVTWSVVSGRAKISETGVLSDFHLGDITLRATSNYDPSVFAEVTIRAKLYTDLSSFVRKTFGHFALFAVLGFGLAASFITLIKPHGASVPVALASGFGMALLSETLQLPIFTQGRLFAWSDVLVDFAGAIAGMLAFYLMFALILLIFRLRGRKDELMTALACVSATTMFKKAPAHLTTSQTSESEAPCPDDTDAICATAMDEASADVVDGADSAEDAGAAKTD